MDFEPVYEKICFGKHSGDFKEQIKVESKTDISVLEVSSILSVTGFSFVEEPVVMNGKVGYEGKLNFYVCYVDEQGEVKKVECGAEFKGAFSDAKIKASDKARISVEIVKTEADVSGARLLSSAYLNVKCQTEESQECSALVSGGNLVVQEKEIEYNKSLGIRTGSYPLEEEFEVAYAVKEVLFHRVEACITAVQCGVGTIIVDGEGQIDVIMLQKSQKRDIIKESKRIPFRMEIECEDAMPSMSAVAFVKERSFKTNVSVDEEKGVSTVNVSANLFFSAECFSKQTVTIANDAFSTNKEIEIEEQNICFNQDLEQRALEFPVRGRAIVGELPVGANLTATCGERAEIVKRECAEGVVSVTGIMHASALFTDNDGRVFTRKIEIPFEVKEQLNSCCCSNIDTIVKIRGAETKIISLTEVEGTFNVCVSVYPKEQRLERVVKSATEKGDLPVKEGTISVYISTEGENLWSLAKRLKVSPETLVQTNKELCFPLTGNERIVIIR